MEHGKNEENTVHSVFSTVGEIRELDALSNMMFSTGFMAKAPTGGKSENSLASEAPTGGKSENSRAWRAATGGESENSLAWRAATGGESENSTPPLAPLADRNKPVVWAATPREAG